MSNELDAFLKSTESGQAGIAPPAARTLQYPFLYMTEITDVEISYLVGSGTLIQEALDDTYIQLFLRGGGYRLLGFIKLNFDSIMHLNYLREHEIMIKVDKDTETSVTANLIDSLLLSR